MPTLPMLYAAGCGRLADALRRHGGVVTVAARLGLPRLDTRKPAGYWDDFTHVEDELRMFIAAHAMDPIMPTRRMLETTGRHDLARAIQRYSGFAAVAARLGLTVIRRTSPAGYWADFTNLERELLAFIQTHGTPGVMPLQKDLVAAQRSDLQSAITNHGGFATVAARLNLVRSHTIKPIGY